MKGELARVVLVEDHKLMRQSQRRAIEEDGRLEFAGEASSGQAGIDLIRSCRPDVASVDLKMSPLDGWAVLDAVREEGLSTRVVFVSAFEEAAVVQRALGAGAAGFISKGTEGTDLCDLLLRAAGGERAVSSDLQDQLIQRLGDTGTPSLTERELEVLRCLAESLSADATAKALHVSVATVRTHVASILRKLDASNSVEAVTKGFRLGLLT